MNMMMVKEIEAFVHLDYASRDIMHNLAHIHRLRRLAKEIARSYEHDSDLLELGAYFHGNIAFKEAEIRQFLNAHLLEGGKTFMITKSLVTGRGFRRFWLRRC